MCHKCLQVGSLSDATLRMAHTTPQLNGPLSRGPHQEEVRPFLQGLKCLEDKAAHDKFVQSFVPQVR